MWNGNVTETNRCRNLSKSLGLYGGLPTETCTYTHIKWIFCEFSRRKKMNTTSPLPNP